MNIVALKSIIILQFSPNQHFLENQGQPHRQHLYFVITHILLHSVIQSLSRLDLPWVFKMTRSTLVSNESRFIPVILSFFLFYATLIALSPLIFAILLYRAILSWTISIVTNGKWRIVGKEDAAFGIDCPGSVYTINYFIRCEGSCNIHNLREAVKFRLYRNQGHNPFRKMLCAVVPKYGYLWWKDKSDNLDIAKHVKHFPEEDGSGSGNIYTEDEVYSAMAKITDLEWPVGQPLWEILVTPQVRKADSGAIGHIITLRIHHMYADGISAVHAVRHIIADYPMDMMFDTVNPPIPKVNIGLRALLYLQIFLMGPYVALRGNLFRHREPFKMGPLKGPKYFGKLPEEIPVDTLRILRRHYGCSTQAIWHSILNGALARIATEKGFKVPPRIIGGINFARFPYPNEGLHNRVIFGLEPVPIGVRDRVSRLVEMDQTMTRLTRNPYTLMTSAVMIQLFGLLPTKVARVLTGNEVCNYLLSNVPGVDPRADGEIVGNRIEWCFGIPPLTNGIHYSFGIVPIRGKFRIGIGAEHSLLISSRAEFDNFIQAIVNEFKCLTLNI